MKFWKKESQTLMEFGLTLSQVKVYLSLIRLGADSKANTIFKFSNVSRQDVYRILTELQNLGLVEKIIARPTRFRAVPVHEAANILLKRKMKVCSELSAKAKELAESAAENYPKSVVQKEGDRFALITEREAITLKTKDAIENSRESMYFISPYKELVSWLAGVSEFLEAMKRGVKISCVVESPKDTKRWSIVLQNFIENPQFNLRVVPSLPKAKFGIFDNKEVIMALFVAYNAGESPALWSDNPSLLSVAEGYFQALWKKGIEVNPKSVKFKKGKKLGALMQV